MCLCVCFDRKASSYFCYCYFEFTVALRIFRSGRNHERHSFFSQSSPIQFRSLLHIHLSNTVHLRKTWPVCVVCCNNLHKIGFPEMYLLLSCVCFLNGIRLRSPLSLSEMCVCVSVCVERRSAPAYSSVVCQCCGTLDAFVSRDKYHSSKSGPNKYRSIEIESRFNGKWHALTNTLHA